MSQASMAFVLLPNSQRQGIFINATHVKAHLRLERKRKMRKTQKEAAGHFQLADRHAPLQALNPTNEKRHLVSPKKMTELQTANNPSTKKRHCVILPNGMIAHRLIRALQTLTVDEVISILR